MLYLGGYEFDIQSYDLLHPSRRTHLAQVLSSLGRVQKCAGSPEHGRQKT